MNVVVHFCLIKLKRRGNEILLAAWVAYRAWISGMLETVVFWIVSYIKNYENGDISKTFICKCFNVDAA